MKNIVLYKSKYGNTLQYATWIAEELGWEIRDFSDFKKQEIKNYQHVIFGSGVYMGKMNQIKKVLQYFKEKPIIIFACAGNNNVEKDIDDIKKNNFQTQQLTYHKFFYLPGGVDFSKMTGITKMMINFFRKLMEKKLNKTADEQAILDGFTNPTNYVDKSHIQELISYVQSLYF
jgi:menaquinone-dependent protoporphyrinogen IX oxidase